MKAYSIPPLALLAAIFMVSCNDGGLIESDIRPEAQVKQRDAQSEKEIVFTSWQELVIAQPECPLFTDALAREHVDEVAKPKLRCISTYGFLGSGHGFADSLDRFTIDTRITFDPQPQSFTGLVTIDLSSSASTLQLKVEGPAESRYHSEEGMIMELPVKYYAGSGMFERVEFVGTLKLMHADEVFNTRNTEFYATIEITGKMIMN